MKKHKPLSLFLFLLTFIFANSQVGIGTIIPNGSAVLDITAINQGILLPRFSDVQILSINVPASGLMVFNTTTKDFNFYDNGLKAVLKAVISPSNGGIGLANNATATMHLSNSFALSLTTLSATAVVLPTSGGLYGTKPSSVSSLALHNSLFDETGTGLVSFSDELISGGTPTAPTALPETSSNQIATTAYFSDTTDRYYSVNDANTNIITSLTDQLIPNITHTPVAGKYLVLFKAHYQSVLMSSLRYNNRQSITDLELVYNTLMAAPVTNTTHIPAFGSGETLMPGVYTIPGALSVAGVLTLNGGGNPDAVFIFRALGAIAAGAITSIELLNGTKACNVFWVAEGDIAIAAASSFKGTCISHVGALAIAAPSILEGRMYTFLGAITLGPSVVTLTPACGFINFGVLDSFVLFTGGGNISNTAISTISGNIGTNSGTVTGLESSTHFGQVFINAMLVTPTANINPLAVFSFYQNGIEVPFSSRSYNALSTGVDLQVLLTIDEGHSIDVRCRTNENSFNLFHKALTMVRVR